jgi:hypothetical protein
MRYSTWAGVAFAVAAIACDQPASSPTALRDQGASFGKGGLTNPTATLYISNDASSLFRGDGIAAYLEGETSAFAGSSRYKDGECGVMAAVNALSGGSGDMVFGSAANQDHKCAAFPRKGRMTFALINADGTVTVDRTETTGFGGNLGQLEQAVNGSNPGFYIAVGESALRGLHLSDGVGELCNPTTGNGGIAFRPVLNTGVYVGADDVSVHRDAPDTWTVTSHADEVDAVTGNTIHHDKAYCKGNGKMYHLPLRFSIKTSRALTP